MDNLTREKEINNYLQEQGVNTEEIVVWGHKYLINTRSPKVFNKIAQVSKIEEISEGTGSLIFTFEKERDWWTIALDNTKTNEFSKKYGNIYQIN